MDLLNLLQYYGTARLLFWNICLKQTTLSQKLF